MECISKLDLKWLHETFSCVASFLQVVCEFGYTCYDLQYQTCPVLSTGGYLMLTDFIHHKGAALHPANTAKKFLEHGGNSGSGKGLH